jgi:2,4-dienoyl-CoA reductase
MATVLVSLGAQVAIASRRLNVLQETAAEIQAKTGAKVLPVQMNIKNPDEIKAAADKVESEIGLPNVVINNAAGNFIAPSERLSPNALRTIVETVLMGTAWVTLEFAQRMIKQKQGGTFLAITTPYARSGSAFVMPSATSKAGVDTMTKSLAAEWGKYGLRFNVIAPGPIQTEGAFSRLDPSGQFAERLLDDVPTGRMGTVEELANLASYLVSDYSSWMSGSIVDLDGGQNVAIGSHFQQLQAVGSEQWDLLEQMIRGGNERNKKSRL